MAKPIYVLNGPNLNLLGTREPEIYGYDTLETVQAACVERARALGHDIVFHQSNHEGQLVDWLQEAREAGAGVLLNAGALTHTSIALHDAIKALSIPVIEVHLSNPLRRESFRHVSHIGTAAHGTICGFGIKSYELAIEAVASLIAKQS
jgi:3-dehydroquinate dehydratase II